MCEEVRAFLKYSFPVGGWEKATLQTIEDGYMTGDIARIATPAAKKVLDSWEYIAEIKARLEKML